MTGRTGNAVFSPANERPASHGTNRLIGSLPAGCAFVLAYISRLQGKCVGGVPCPIGRAREKTPKGAWRRPRVMVRVRHHVWEWRTPDDVTRQSDNCEIPILGESNGPLLSYTPAAQQMELWDESARVDRRSRVRCRDCASYGRRLRSGMGTNRADFRQYPSRG